MFKDAPKIHAERSTVSFEHSYVIYLFIYWQVDKQHFKL